MHIVIFSKEHVKFATAAKHILITQLRGYLLIYFYIRKLSMLACICLFHPLAALCVAWSPAFSQLYPFPVSHFAQLFHDSSGITSYFTIIHLSHPPHSFDWSICSACLNHLNPPLHITTPIHSSQPISLCLIFMQQGNLYPLDHLHLYAIQIPAPPAYITRKSTSPFPFSQFIQD